MIVRTAMKRALPILFCSLVAGVLLSPLGVTLGAQSQPSLPEDSEIRAILADRVDRYKQSVGIVVGIVEPRGRRVIAYGSLAAGDPRPINGDTVFEIGSITKVFTSLMLADMAERGEVKLDDAAARYLPDEVRMPERGDREIALLDLATHTSGLPRMPLNVESSDPANPFADYSVERLYEFLSIYRLPRDIASAFEYSNVGGALLGHVLARRARTDYAALVQTRIARPLGMTSTRVDLTPDMKARLAVGHAYGLEPTPNWELGALTGAGGVLSTANDMITFLEANLGYKETPLAAAMSSMLKVRRNTGLGQIGLGWLIENHGGAEVVLHDGSTGGYRSFAGYNRATRVGVVVLSNSGTGAGVSDIGIHLLTGSPVLSGNMLTPPKLRREIQIDAALLDQYSGQYRFPSRQEAVVSHDGSHLVLKADGEAPLEFFAESDTEFFCKMMDAQIVFSTGRDGRVNELIFLRGGEEHHVRRID